MQGQTQTGSPVGEQPRGYAERLAGASDFWAAYRSMRLRIAVQPLSPTEAGVAQHTARAMQDWLGLDAQTALSQARRSVLFQRERLFHEGLILDLAPARLWDLLQSITVHGLEQVRPLHGRGMLLVSLHYSLFSSLLCLWLARAAAEGRLGPLTVLFDSGSLTGAGLPPERIETLEAARLGNRRTTTLLDLATAPGAARELVGRLHAGETVLIFPDRYLASTADRRALCVRLGKSTAAVPRGVAWLAQRARCPVVPVHLRPDGDGHALLFGQPLRTDIVRNAHPVVQVVLQRLFDQTVLADPGPWEGWPMLPDIAPPRLRPQLTRKGGRRPQPTVTSSPHRFPLTSVPEERTLV